MPHEMPDSNMSAFQHLNHIAWKYSFSLHTMQPLLAPTWMKCRVVLLAAPRSKRHPTIVPYDMSDGQNTLAYDTCMKPISGLGRLLFRHGMLQGMQQCALHAFHISPPLWCLWFFFILKLWMLVPSQILSSSFTYPPLLSTCTVHPNIILRLCHCYHVHMEHSFSTTCSLLHRSSRSESVSYMWWMIRASKTSWHLLLLTEQRIPAPHSVLASTALQTMHETRHFYFMLLTWMLFPIAKGRHSSETLCSRHWNSCFRQRALSRAPCASCKRACHLTPEPSLSPSPPYTWNHFLLAMWRTFIVCVSIPRRF